LSNLKVLITNRILPAVLAAAGLFSMTACSLPNSSVNTTVSLDETGAITETIVEAKEQDFTEEELETYIKSAIDTYNGGSEMVALDSCEASSGSVKIVMNYASDEDYASFNQVPFFAGTIREAEDAGYDVLGQDFAEANGTPADMEIVEQRAKEWKVIVVSEDIIVRAPDKILYATDNVEITGRLTADVETVLDDTAASSGTEEVTADSGSAESTSAETEENIDPAAVFATYADRYAYIIYK